jgi:hypothetical protein
VLREEDDGRARRYQLMAAAFLLSLLFSALWGAAAGSTSLALALGNLYRVPMVILSSTLCAVPAGLLAWRLSGAAMRGTDLMLAFAAAVLSATLVLAVFAPLIALYYHTSAWAGPILGMGSAFLSLALGAAIFVRGVRLKVPASASWIAARIPSAVILVFVTAALVQFITIASPILPEVTAFDGGVDRILSP